jgi:deoxyribodipyrimidine photo-lyase
MKKSLCWIRRDLRIHDHYALSEALRLYDECYLVFIFDEHILKQLKNKQDSRITFIFDSLKEIEKELQKIGSSLLIRFGNPLDVIPQIISDYKLDALLYNRDYEPYAKKRDEKIKKILLAKNIHVSSYKDHVFFESSEIKNGSGETYKVFTPYKNKWLETFRTELGENIPNYKCPLKKMAQFTNKKNILEYDWLHEIGFSKSPCNIIGGTLPALKNINNFKKYISDYKTARDFPALDQTSGISPYIRFGNISIRDLIRLAVNNKTSGHETWLSEIIWRDFYQTILDVFPYVEKKCFRAEYDKIKWLGKKADFQKWCDGETGYPVIDSAMRCLNTTGLMHNRLRMVVASFLTKTLLINWQWGEKYFAEKLLDYDLAANNGGWQWSASTGVDAQPYFRIFNPYNQSKKFDPQGIFIKRWCPELCHLSAKEIHSPDTFSTLSYPHPIVSYREQRVRALAMYKKIH